MQKKNIGDLHASEVESLMVAQFRSGAEGQEDSWQADGTITES